MEEGSMGLLLLLQLLERGQPPWASPLFHLRLRPEEISGQVSSEQGQGSGKALGRVAYPESQVFDLRKPEIG